MALKLDDNLLTELGLGSLPPEEKKAFLAHIYETLEMRVGVRLAEQMSEQQLSEFEALINAGDDAGAFKWLETTFPGYKEVVADEFEKLKLEIRQVAPQIIASSQQNAAAAPQAPSAEAQQPPEQQQAASPPQHQPPQQSTSSQQPVETTPYAPPPQPVYPPAPPPADSSQQPPQQ